MKKMHVCFQKARRQWAEKLQGQCRAVTVRRGVGSAEQGLRGVAFTGKGGFPDRCKLKSTLIKRSLIPRKASVYQVCLVCWGDCRGPDPCPRVSEELRVQCNLEILRHLDVVSRMKCLAGRGGSGR